ncbi:hypothetical protein NE237_001030 [Protea cynaroides]|uniref:Uncharacterized protein n=1 Tax=Protea cynaroides TaxID=273540 RepID=A0A9Q0KTC9_9MAGN|nr:hypothetical protein NE237_001030 [Protea cynaroides]
MYIEYMLEEQRRYLGANPSVSFNLPCSFASVSICRQLSSFYLETGMPTPLSPSLFTGLSLPDFLVSLSLPRFSLLNLTLFLSLNLTLFLSAFSLLSAFSSFSRFFFRFLFNLDFFGLSSI